MLVGGCALYLECVLDRFVDGFGENSLVVGRIVAASVLRSALRGTDVDDSDLLHGCVRSSTSRPGVSAWSRQTHAFPLPPDFSR